MIFDFKIESGVCIIKYNRLTIHYIGSRNWANKILEDYLKKYENLI